jgi:crotonobetainyl-CoA:carnitine CoA-transferase CaiB-like acyl-CoA transferase
VERKPLSGIRILDFTWVRAGPWACRWLAALGAEVIKVEWLQPGTGTFNSRGGGAGVGDAVQANTPPGVPPGFNSNGQFNDTNAGKLGITLNVRDPRGLELTRRLVGMSDIVIENFSSRVMENWGLGYEELRAIKPDIIYVSMAGFGHVGSKHEYVTMGPVVQAFSGLTQSSGLPGKPPAGWGWSYMDDTGGMYGVISTLTALHHRNATGQGQHVDMSQVAAAITLTGPVILDYVLHGRGSRREGFPAGNRAVWPGTPVVNNYRGPIVAPHNAYRTAAAPAGNNAGYNDWCTIVCLDDGEWRALVGVMGNPAWAQEARFATNAGRIEHQEALDAGIEAWARTLGKYEVMRVCQAAGVRSMPVQSNQDRVDHDPQLRWQGMYEPHFHGVLGTNLMQNFPFTLSDSSVRVERPSPLVAEHNREVLGGLLGVPDAEIKAGQEEGLFWPQSLKLPEYVANALDTPLQARPPLERPAVVDAGRAERFAGGPLGDLRVLELADEKGQWAGKLLADLGADVIKIEPPEGSSERQIGPFYQDVPDPERSLRFWHYNTSKRGVTLDLHTEEGRERFRRLVATADVVLETFAPGTMAALGLGYEQLRALNPRLIMCSLTDFGQTGPWRDFKGSDLLHLAAGGQMASCGYSEDDVPDAPPMAPGGGNAWHMGSHYAYIAIMAAVNARDYTGEGRYIDASVHGACALTTEGHVVNWIYGKQVFRRRTGGNGSQQAVKDGYVNAGGVARFTPASLRTYVDWMDRYGLAQDLTAEKYQDQAVINESREHIMEVIQNFYRNTPQVDITGGAQERGFPTGTVQAAEDNLNEPHWRERGFWVELEDPEIGRTVTYPGGAAIFSATPWRLSRRAPHLGEHNDEVFASFEAREGVRT